MDSSIDIKSKAQLFIESSLSQSEKIVVFSFKPVYSIECNTYTYIDVESPLFKEIHIDLGESTVIIIS